MKARDRRTRTQMLPQGYVQELLPLYQKPVAEASVAPGLSDEPSAQLPTHAFANLATALRAAFCDLANLRTHYTVLHGKKAERLLERVQAVACEQMALLEQQWNQPPLLDRLRRLYVECRGALVTVQGVCGLAETGLLLRDHTGAYWQFGNALLLLQRSCEDIAIHFTRNESLDQSFSARGVLSA